MNIKSFLLNTADLVFEGMQERTVCFLGPEANLDRTHISLIVGANGTSKSRLLASLVEHLCEFQTRIEKPESKRRTQSVHAIKCRNLTTIVNRQSSGINNNSDLFLPSKILVLSNLVMDKFHYFRENSTKSPFYLYLGVRQATNLTTTGSLDRAVTEAVLNIVNSSDLMKSFQKWIKLIFQNECELALQFPKFRREEILKYLNTANKETLVRERMQRRPNIARSLELKPNLISETTEQISKLFDFLERNVIEYKKELSSGRKESIFILRLSNISDDDRRWLLELPSLVAAATKADYFYWPTLCFESSPWLQFNQLSSGEQNILSVGAKLIAYAKPGCLIAIDEPEVSLNVAWQQHYTNLISNSLDHAPGSHVLIATHSPHLIASLPKGNASLVMIEKKEEQLFLKTVDAKFEGWGAESILFQVLGIPSASSFLFNRELAKVLGHIQDGGEDKKLITDFLEKAKKLDFAGVDALEEVVSEINAYLRGLS